MIKRILTFFLLLTLSSEAMVAQETYVPSAENLASRQEFAQDRFGIFIHWGIYSMLANKEWVMQHQGLSFDEYSQIAGGFCPSRFKAEEWVKIFKSAGARYITFTSRHHDGFSMYDTAFSDFDIIDATPFGRDVLKELSEACASAGLKLHLYYSHMDWGRNDYYPLGECGRKTGRPAGDENSWGHYLDFMYNQLTELLTGYGPIRCIWFDGTWDKKGKDLDDCAALWQLDRQYKLIHQLQPSCLIGNNHHHQAYPGEDIQIFEQDLPGKNTTGYVIDATVSDVLPLETCQTINKSWGYNIYDHNFKSADELVRYLVQTAGNGANLLLNVGPRPDGTLPKEQVERLLAMGKWLDKYGESIYGTEGGCTGEQPWGVSTQKGNVLYVHNLYGKNAILVPVKGNTLVSATTFDGGRKLAFSQVPEGIVLTLPEREAGEPDQIIKLVFKKPVQSKFGRY